MNDAQLLKEREEILEKVITRAWADASFKEQLLQDPAKAVESAFGVKLPASLKVQVLEETADKRYVVIPYRPSADDQLSPEELEAVAGGVSGGRVGGIILTRSLYRPSLSSLEYQGQITGC